MATTPPSLFSFALVGAGNVGTAVGELLHRAGREPRAVSSRTLASAQRAAALFGCDIVAPDRLPPVDVVLLGVPADAVEEVATVVGPQLREGAVVVHFAGSVGIEPLRPVLGHGGRRAALHPVQACPDVARGIERIPGCAWGITYDDGLGDWATAFVAAAGGHAHRVADEDRAVWHAAAVVTSNATSAVLAVGESLLQTIGQDDPVAVLGPLATGTVANAFAGGGGAQTLTGPAVRGEAATLQRHLAAIARAAPELSGAYRAATRLTIDAAARAGRIDDAVARDMRAILDT